MKKLRVIGYIDLKHEDLDFHDKLKKFIESHGHKSYLITSYRKEHTPRGLNVPQHKITKLKLIKKEDN